jgi:hypothetical protein
MARNTTLAKIVSLVAALSSASCDSASKSACDECADTDCPDAACPDAGCGGDTDAGTDGAWQCPDPIAETCPEGASEALPLIFNASDFGEGTRFVDVAPWTVLAERDASDVRTISVITCRSVDGYSIYPCDASTARRADLELSSDSGLHAVALANGSYENETWSPSHLAVLCDDASCALYGADLFSGTPDTALTPIPGGALPETAIVYGLWWSGEDTPACVYGDGIHCFDGTAWTSPIQANAESPAFNDMTTSFFGGSTGAIAVGDLGRIALSGFPYWNGGSWGASLPDWLAVACYEDGCAIAGTDGALTLKIGDEWHDGCVLGDEDIAELISVYSGWGQAMTSLGATASGRVFVDANAATEMESPCYTGQVVGASPKAVTFDCGAATNVFLADETALYGTMNCIVD